MRIFICDDENTQINITEGYIDELSKIYHKIQSEVFYSGNEMIKHYKELDKAEFPDIIYLDIGMEGLNGLETAKKIRSFDKNVLIVFMTSFGEFVYEAYKSVTFRYLVKPILYEEFKEVFIDAYNIIKSDENQIFCFNIGKKAYQLHHKDIIYFESNAKKAIIHTNERSYEIYRKLSDIYQEVGDDNFFKIHKSYLVNMNYVQDIGWYAEKKITLRTGKSLRISESCRTTARRTYKNFVVRSCKQ